MSGADVQAGAGFWKNRRVLVTGHTGFKGAWLARWLVRLGADVTGYSLAPLPDAPLFDQLELSSKITHVVGDIRDQAAFTATLAEAAPDCIFHLAAQSLVLTGYENPVETWSTNVMGTVSVLDAIRQAGNPASVVCVTTDKVYADQKWSYPYREDDRLGGRDPYAASKAACELVVSSYREAFLEGSDIRLATARAGNVIGGGDWARNRLVPDIVRALQQGETITLRQPHAIRPWQHVLEPLGGYLRLMRLLHESGGEGMQTAWNFGPDRDGQRTTSELVKAALRHWPGHWESQQQAGAPVETGVLKLAIDKAADQLGWAPVFTFDAAIEQTMQWYRQAADGALPAMLTDRQIDAYQARARL